MKYNNGKINIGIIITILIIIIVGIWFFTKGKTENTTTQNSTQGTEKWTEYKNDQLGISFNYPPEYGQVNIKFNDNQSDKTKQFIGTFSNNTFTFGSPTTCELCDANTNQYSFQGGVGALQNKISEAYGNISAVFILKNQPDYRTVEFYGASNELNKKIVSTVTIY